MRHWSRVLAVLAWMPAVAGAQGKKALTQDTYDSWRQIQGATLSADGKWVVYTLTPVVGNGEVVVRATQGTTEYRAPRGWTGRPVTSVTVDSPFVAVPAQITADSRHAVFLAYAPKADFDRARAERRPAAQQPRASLGLMSLADGRVSTVPRVRSFRLARESGTWLAYLLEPDPAPRDSSTGPAMRQLSDSLATRTRRRDYGSTLVVRNLVDGTEDRLADVTTYAFDDSGRVLVYAVASRTPQSDGVYLRTLATKQTATVMAGEGDYRSVVLDRAGTQLAFVSNRTEFAQPKPRFSLYHATVRSPAATLVAAPGSVDGLSPSERGRTDFTRDGSAILFSVAPPAADTIPADSLADKAVFDLWHYQDKRLQPQQKIEVARDRDRTWAAVHLLRARRSLRLANDTMPQVTVSDDARVALTTTNVPYAVEAMWGDGGTDAFVTDLATGRISTVARRLEFGAQLSPGGRFVTYFDKGAWHAWNPATGQARSLTGTLTGIRFDDETNDSPTTASPYGIAGWTREDRSVLVYDRWDVWELDPLGVRAPRVLTDSLGRRNTTIMRLVDLDPDDRFVDPAQPVLVRAFNEETKASGYYRDWLDRTAAPERLVWGDRNYGTPSKARRAEQYLFTQQTVAEFPDLWTGPSLAAATKVTNANPQQAEYRWPSVELVHWISSDGTPLKGLVYTPEGFDRTKQYPMVVYYYEMLSDGLHNYHAPTGRNVVNPSVYTSLGYVVFFPDIVYEVGWPGPSAQKAIIPGVQSLIAKGYVNPKAIGIAGQSWGGYQSAYLITQTGMFAAAVPNAPVANMTSAYGGIRWESGMARPFQYEKTQSRIGGSLWEYPVRYIENSPLFHLDRVTTPVLFMHNDADGAVPWYQGIELFVGLRRLGKEVYMVTYNGDGHNPRKRANQMDIDMRMQQFFANKLKGEPAPEWMVKGIPAVDKGKDQMKKLVP
ncbi:MAG: S9 family peptidase [Gemmatimonadaceae bacterium]|nr:S9 family peptidase [Gemmatimonadaceae bacterium]